MHQLITVRIIGARWFLTTGVPLRMLLGSHAPVDNCEDHWCWAIKHQWFLTTGVPLRMLLGNHAPVDNYDSSLCF
jgi:hypothetical protein